MVTEGAGTTVGTVAVDGVESTGVVELGGVPCAVAVSTTEPASTSAWDTVWVAFAVQVSDAPGANELCGHVVAPPVGSDTLTLDSVTFPLFVTTYE
jgi:acyl-coenzyme A synthetase/AMP-(fatty) acid ligase